jgi:protein-disulfide isomerase
MLLTAGLAEDAAAQSAAEALPKEPVQAEAAGPLALRAGPAAAPAHLVVFCNITAEPCQRLVAVLNGVLEAHPDRVAVTFRHVDDKDQEAGGLAYRAALAAAIQGRGWAMLDLACANPDRLDEGGLRSMAVQLGLDADRVMADVLTDAVAERVAADEAAAKELAPGSVPAGFVNGRRFPGPWTFDALVAALK